MSPGPPGPASIKDGATGIEERLDQKGAVPEVQSVARRAPARAEGAGNRSDGCERENTAIALRGKRRAVLIHNDPGANSTEGCPAGPRAGNRQTGMARMDRNEAIERHPLSLADCHHFVIIVDDEIRREQVIQIGPVGEEREDKAPRRNEEKKGISADRDEHGMIGSITTFPGSRLVPKYPRRML